MMNGLDPVNLSTSVQERMPLLSTWRCWGLPDRRQNQAVCMCSLENFINAGKVMLLFSTF